MSLTTVCLWKGQGMADDAASMDAGVLRLDRPDVWLVGDVAAADFSAARVLLRADARLSVETDATVACERLRRSSLPPELILLAHARPDSISRRAIRQLRKTAPLAGIVALLGSWCEGESRTGRPAPGVLRLYWHEFLPWWQQQRRLRAAGRCPDWSRPEAIDRTGPAAVSPPTDRGGLGGDAAPRGLVVLQTARWETADALADELRRSGHATVWQRPGGPLAPVRGALAGIWEGGQLDAREAGELQRFCARLAKDDAPVAALLDFPRFDRNALAAELGAAAVLGKPWSNGDFIATLRHLIAHRQQSRQTPAAARAA